MAFPNDIEPLTQAEAIGIDTNVWPRLYGAYHSETGEFIGYRVNGGGVVVDGELIDAEQYAAVREDILRMDRENNNLLASRNDARMVRYMLGLIYPGSYTFAVVELYKEGEFHDYR